MYKRYIKLIMVNLILVIILIVAYSPGLCSLQPNDISILRAGLSILIAPISIITAILANLKLIMPGKTEYIKSTEGIDIEQAKRLLRTYTENGPFLTQARTAYDQLERLQNITRKTLNILDIKFETGSMSYERFASIIESAYENAIKNIILMTNRMQMFSPSEYHRLKNYKNDDIPDDIQEKQLAFYERIRIHTRQTIEINEKIIYNMTELMAKCAESETNTIANDSVIQELETLTDQLKYYQET